MAKKIKQIGWISAAMLLLSACSSFTGIRTPKYDGQPFEVYPEKIAAYENSQEVIGEEKENYIPEAFSADILKPSLDYIEHEPILLEEGTYLVGEDVPAGRVSLIGEKEDPTLVISGFHDPNAIPSPEDYRVGTMTIRDAEGNFYFENMFHPFYGVKIIQVDFIEGHTIEIYGEKPEVVVFYDEKLPDDPYVFDTRWEEYLAELEEQEGFVEFVEVEESEDEEAEVENDGVNIPVFEQEQPIKISEDGQFVELNAGIYEVGKHFEAGTYEIVEQSASTHTEIFLFSGNNEPRVFEVTESTYGTMMYGWGHMNEDATTSNHSSIELKVGDKIFPHYVHHLKLKKID